MAIPTRNYSDPAGVSSVAFAATFEPGRDPTPVLARASGLVLQKAPQGGSPTLMATPPQAPNLLVRVIERCGMTSASNAFMQLMERTRRRGWQIYPSGLNR